MLVIYADVSIDYDGDRMKNASKMWFCFFHIDEKLEFCPFGVRTMFGVGEKLRV
jgi:hypothetical protein